MKIDRDNLKKELVVARDSISTMEKVILRQDTALFVCDTTRTVLESKIEDLKGTIKAKDGQINERNKKIADLESKFKGAIVDLGLASLGFIIILL